MPDNPMISSSPAEAHHASPLSVRSAARGRQSDAWDYGRFGQRWYWLPPLFAIILLISVMLVLFWALRADELDRARQSLLRDVEWATHTMRLHLEANQNDAFPIARELGEAQHNPQRSPAQFEALAHTFLKARPELAGLAWIDPAKTWKWVIPAETAFNGGFRTAGAPVDEPESLSAFDIAAKTHQPTYSHAFVGPDNDVYVEMHIPVVAQGHFGGTLVGLYSITGMARVVVPKEISTRYNVSILDANGAQLAGMLPGTSEKARMQYELPLNPPLAGLSLRAISYHTRSNLQNNFLVWTIVVLMIFMLWSLWSLLRHMRHRVEAESARDRLFNLSLDILCVMDNSGTLLRLNPAFSRVLGRDPEALRGSSLLDLLHPDDRPSTQAELRKLAAGEPGISFENRCRRLNEDGTTEYRWLVWAFTPDLQAKPDKRLLYAVAHDVTQRRARQQALITETAFRRAMEDSVLTGMRAFDLQGRITYVNPAFCRMLGFSSEDLVGTSPPYPYWPDEHVQHEETMHLILSGQAPASGMEVRVRRKDGRDLDVRMYVSPLIDENSVQSGWMTSMTDITEPKRIRQELATAHERFTTVLEGLDAAVSVYGGARDGNELLFANRYYRRLFGKTAAGHRELSLNAVAPATPDEPARTGEVYSAAIQRWFEVRQRALQWVDRRMVRIQVATDISARRSAEELARQQQEKVQLTSRLITMGEMASSLAHELNQPLTAIANYSMGTVARVRAYLELTRAGQPANIDPDMLLEALQKTSSQAERAGKIIRRIREFVKRSEPRRQRCKIRTILDDAIGLAEIEATKRRIAIRVNIPDDIPEVEADPILIEQVLLNLMKNGVEAMFDADPPADARYLQVQVRDTGTHIEFAVTDRGNGIAAEVKDKLFEPFYSTKSEGMGMGLNICRSIIEFHHGRLWAINNPEGGCTFCFTLPSVTARAAILANSTPTDAGTAQTGA